MHVWHGTCVEVREQFSGVDTLYILWRLGLPCFYHCVCQANRPESFQVVHRFPLPSLAYECWDYMTSGFLRLLRTEFESCGLCSKCFYLLRHLAHHQVLFSMMLNIPDSTSKENKWNKHHEDWKGRNKMLLFTDGRISYIWNPKWHRNRYR